MFQCSDVRYYNVTAPRASSAEAVLCNVQLQCAQGARNSADPRSEIGWKEASRPQSQSGRWTPP
eukprot:scaffold88042_cov43-Tisochrysis_lutea.AAC.1